MSTPQSARPATVQGIEISVTSDGYVVYDPALERIHYLNASSALIMELCNGENSIEDLSQAVMQAFDLDFLPFEETQTCVEQLADENLVTL